VASKSASCSLCDASSLRRFWDAYKKAAEQMFDTEKEIIIDNSNMAGGEKLEEHLEEWKKVRSTRALDAIIPFTIKTFSLIVILYH
jgi:hypothetical protein